MADGRLFQFVAIDAGREQVPPVEADSGEDASLSAADPSAD